MRDSDRSNDRPREVFDFVVIGSGFGGSVSAMRLAEEGYRVLVLERGRRYRDEDFPRSNWFVWKYLWLPIARCFGFQSMTLLKGVLVLHGTGVGGGSLVYASVMMEPEDQVFESPGWREMTDWKTTLRPHYDTVRRMLGVTSCTVEAPSDAVLRSIAEDMGRGDRMRPTEVALFLGHPGHEGELVPDPYFGGSGPSRAGCNHCGGCLVGCRFNSKNSLVKNYLYLAERLGAEIRAEAEVRDIRPLPDGQPDGTRYEVLYQRSTALLSRPALRVRARSVVVAAGVLGTLKLLFQCRDETRSLPNLSPCLGDLVRTNSEELLAVTSRDGQTDYAKGIAVTSSFKADDQTYIEAAHYPDGSSFLLRLLAAPLVDVGHNVLVRLLSMIWLIARHPIDFLRAKLFPHVSRRSTVLLAMEAADTQMRLRMGRSLFTFFRRGLVAENDAARPVAAGVSIGQEVTRTFASKINGIPLGTFTESLLNIPSTVHILGGCPMGLDVAHGVVDAHCAAFNYPGLYVVDGSIVPANPGVNPSLTIAALAEHAMSQISVKPGLPVRDAIDGGD